MFVPKPQHISLRPIDHNDEIPSVGLFLTTDEFTDMVQKTFPAGRFTEDFLEYVHCVTAGHAGAVGDFLRVVLAHPSYRRHRLTQGEYSLEIFRCQLPIREFWSGLLNSGIFRRGLPQLGELQRPEITRIFHRVLTNNHVTMGMLDAKDKESLKTCFQRGWLHAAQSPLEEPLEIQYIFTTPLHQWFVEYYLGSKTLDPAVIQEQTLSEFAINVIRSFSHWQLSSPRKVGVSDTQHPPEAQFQDEFYRCCSEYIKGSLITFPEFGSASRRIDFYIPCKQWGVELLRDCDRFENHSSRFTGSGAYAQMTFNDYVILDFRKSRPRRKHPGMLKLYHVVFSNDYRKVQVLAGSSLDMVREFELLN